MKETYKSRVYTDRPAYADFDAPAKFHAIQSIIAKHLKQHPKAICSYSGGADSDILIDLIERTREAFGLPPVKYAFFNTGLEMKATKDHVKDVARKYGVEIDQFRPKVNIVTASRTYGIPFVSKIMSAGLSEWQKKGIPLSIAQEYEQSEDKAAKTRIEKLRQVEAMPAEIITFSGGEIESDPVTNRVIIRFLDRQEDGVLCRLKANGFHWAPSITAWTRMRNREALAAALRICGAENDRDGENHD